MNFTYTFKVLDRETAERFEKLVNMLLGQQEVTVKVDIPTDERMTSMVFVTIKNKTIKKYETVATIAGSMNAKLMNVKEV